jgi:hypothetical protein
MLRRRSIKGVLALVAGLAMLFVPLAAASGGDRESQTVSLLALLLAILGLALTCLGLSRRVYPRPGYLGVGALVGAYATSWLFPLMGDMTPAMREALRARLLVIGVMNGLGCWLFVHAMRQLFPRYHRGFALTGIALVLVSLFPGQTFLLQPNVGALNMGNPQLQLHAGFLYWTVGSALLVLPFLALTTLPGDWFERQWEMLARRAMAIRERRFAAGVALAAFLLAAFFSVYSFDRRATTADEIAQLWHARMLLSGRLALPADPNPEFFAIDNIIDRPLWMSQFPIGGPAVLAIGLLLHAAWLLNPVFTGLTAFNVYRFTQRAYGEAQARAAAVVFAASPMVLIMGGTYMNHTPTAWLATLALAALPVWVAATDARALRVSAAIIGASVGLAITIRPLDGVVVGTVMGLLMLAVANRDRHRAPSLLVAIAAGAVPVLLLLAANWRLTGEPLRFGYEVLWGANHSLGLHDDPTGNPHTPWRAFLLGIKYAAQLNWIATAWPVPVLLIIAVGIVAAKRLRRWDVVLLALFGAQLVVYAFYWHDGQFIGPRFMFTAIPAVLILAARAPFLVAPSASGVWRRVVVATIPVCIGVSWLRTMPPFGVQALATEFRESRSRLKVDPPAEIASGAVDRALIFVQEGAATRLLHRLWGIGVSRPDASRLLARADACSLLEVIRAEERRAPQDTAGQLRRIEAAVKPYQPTGASPRVPDHNFRISDTAGVTPACASEIAYDMQVKNTIAYGGMLLLNQIDDSGRVGGRAVYLMDLGERNEVLRGRFGDRRWFRYELPIVRRESEPVLVPYEAR